jgi:hypothetical protein
MAERLFALAGEIHFFVGEYYHHCGYKAGYH